MKKFFQDVLLLKFATNSQDNPLHEQQVEALLIKHKLKYQAQPNGIQNSPDFRVYLADGSTVDVECKSSQQAYPTYNGGLPKKDVVYIFSSKKYDETTIYFAQDVVSDAKRDLYAEYLDKQAALLEEYRSMPEWKEDDRGFDFYNRAMYTQSGGAVKTNYFTHTKRNYCEQRVINHNW
jgi:hypothetical protein